MHCCEKLRNRSRQDHELTTLIFSAADQLCQFVPKDARLRMGFLFCLSSLAALPLRGGCLGPWLAAAAVLSVLYCLAEAEAVAAVTPLPPPPPPPQFPPPPPPSAKGVGGDSCSPTSAASSNLVVDTDAAAFT